MSQKSTVDKLRFLQIILIFDDGAILKDSGAATVTNLVLTLLLTLETDIIPTLDDRIQ